LAKLGNKEEESLSKFNPTLSRKHAVAATAPRDAESAAQDPDLALVLSSVQKRNAQQFNPAKLVKLAPIVHLALPKLIVQKSYAQNAKSNLAQLYLSKNAQKLFAQMLRLTLTSTINLSLQDQTFSELLLSQLLNTSSELTTQSR